MRSVNVFAEASLVGRLHVDDDRWHFEYDSAWSSAPEAFDLFPGLSRHTRFHQDGSAARPIEWFFDNLLPEELLRHTLSKEAGLNGDDVFALLECFGSECTGSLSLSHDEEIQRYAVDLVALPQEKLSSRIATLRGSTLTAGAPKRIALAGAQHKLPVIYRDASLYEPCGFTPSTHILKPNHPDTDIYPASVVNEFITMQLARMVGLRVPAVHMLYVPEPVYLVRRFDRVMEEECTSEARSSFGAERKHIIDACQLLNKPRSLKYSCASIESLNEIIEATSDQGSTRLSLFRWLVFNILVANDDCHLKNLSFFFSADGLRLAPHYDLLATSVYHTRAFANEKATWPQVRMVFPLGNARFFGDVTGQYVLNAGLAMGVPNASARNIVCDVMTRLGMALELMQAEIRKLHSSAPTAAKVHLAAEDRLLRVLRYIIVKEMSARLLI